ncbi:MAG TPA: hypothetical protein PK156_45330, partial [Polyangium sp.]|nr:hypothetical protein [Polyangium sp.]
VPPHAGYICTPTGTCEIAPCEPGWISYPPGPPKDGCPCQVDAGEPNELCANATAAGMVTDAPSSTLMLTGTFSSDNDVDVWTFDSVDVDEMTTNSYHLKIDITSPMPNDAVIMDVIHGDMCTDMPTGTSTNIQSYSWCVNGTSEDGLTGESPCSDTGGPPNQCNDHSSKYFVIVRRNPAAPITCTSYTITVVGGSTDACDFTQKCE